MTWNIGLVFLEKVKGTLENKVQKNLSLAFGALKIAEVVTNSHSNTNPSRAYAFNGSSAQDKSNSATSPYRMNSKIENSERVDSEWDLGHSQGGAEWNENISR